MIKENISTIKNNKNIIIESLFLSICSVLIFIVLVISSLPIYIKNPIIETIVHLLFPMMISFCLFPLVLDYLIQKNSKNKHSEYISLLLRLKNEIFTNKTMLIMTISIIGSIFIKSTNQTVTLSVYALILQLTVVTFLEEFLYRFEIFDILNRGTLSIIFVIVFQGVLFAFINHSGSNELTNLWMRLPVGILLGYIRYLTNDISASFAIHYIWNFYFSL